ncbi:MAG: hypothetical protein R6X12_05135 [bacterium]
MCSQIALACLMLGAGTAPAAQAFLGSPEYTVTVQLNYTQTIDPYGVQGTFSSYTSTAEFKNVRFGPSPSPDFAAWFENRVEGPDGGVAALPALQVHGEGTLGPFQLGPAWESTDEPIQPVITSGPRPFSPHLTLITADMAAEARGEADGEMPPVVPLVPTVWLTYNEGFSIANPELEWEYPGFAGFPIESNMAFFSVPLPSLARGEDLDIRVPYTNECGARGEWKIVFWSEDDSTPAGDSR